jgi:hypothetical protein
MVNSANGQTAIEPTNEINDSEMVGLLSELGREPSVHATEEKGVAISPEVHVRAELERTVEDQERGFDAEDLEHLAELASAYLDQQELDLARGGLQNTVNMHSSTPPTTHPTGWEAENLPHSTLAADDEGAGIVVGGREVATEQVGDDPKRIYIEGTHEHMAPACKACGDILESGEGFERGTNRWHPDCFRCSTCHTLLDTDSNLLLNDGSLTCARCSSNCTACGNKIEDLANALLTIDNEAFCTGCFKCRSCRRDMQKLQYARTKQGFFCWTCYQAIKERKRKIEERTIDSVIMAPPPLGEDLGAVVDGREEGEARKERAGS